MRKIKHWLNSHEFESRGEVNTMPSETVPDQTLSIREIMVRYSRGLPIDGAKVPIWEGEENDLPDPRTLDLAERQELAAEFEEEIRQIKKAHSKKQTAKKDEDITDIEAVQTNDTAV